MSKFWVNLGTLSNHGHNLRSLWESRGTLTLLRKWDRPRKTHRTAKNPESKLNFRKIMISYSPYVRIRFILISERELSVRSAHNTWDTDSASGQESGLSKQHICRRGGQWLLPKRAMSKEDLSVCPLGDLVTWRSGLTPWVRNFAPLPSFPSCTLAEPCTLALPAAPMGSGH